MENNTLIALIKESFCNLTSCKVRNEFIEVETGYSTLNNKFITVFIFRKGDRYIVSDLGWFDQNYYDTPFFEESEDIIRKIKDAYITQYDIKMTLDGKSNGFYYKSTDSHLQLASLIYDLANFLQGVINGYCIQFKNQKEEKQRETFRKDVNSFLQSYYGEKVKLRKPLDDLKDIKFNAIIENRSRLNIITYVTGSSQYYFENDLRKSIVNFDIVNRSKYKDLIDQKITIVNDLTDDFAIEKSHHIYDLLVNKTTHAPIMWSEKENILDIIEV